MFSSIKRLLVAATAILVLLAPSAAFGTVFVGDGGGSASGPAPASRVVSVPRTGSPSQGFDWGDAAVGAAAMLVLLAAGAGAATVARQRRSQPTIAG